MIRSVYVITDGDACKVGITHNPEGRLKGLQTGNPRELKLVFHIFTEEGMACALERKTHNKLSSKAGVGEWFFVKPETAIKTIIASLSDIWGEDTAARYFVDTLSMLDVSFSLSDDDDLIHYRYPLCMEKDFNRFYIPVITTLKNPIKDYIAEAA